MKSYIIPAKIRNYTEQIRESGQYDKEMLSEKDIEEFQEMKKNNQDLQGFQQSDLSMFAKQTNTDNPILPPYINPNEPDTPELTPFRKLLNLISRT